MESLLLDPCVMYRYQDGKISGLMELQVDDTLNAGTTARGSTVLCISQQVHTLIAATKVSFNVIDFSATNGRIKLDQKSYLEPILPLPPKASLTFEDFCSVMPSWPIQHFRRA